MYGMSERGNLVETLVELFDAEPIENILATRVFSPKTTVFLCDEKTPRRKRRVVETMLANWGMKTKTEFYQTDANCFDSILRVMEQILKKHPGCVFDFNGGRDLMLLAAGIFCKEHGVPGFFIDMASLRFYDVFGCACLKEKFILPRFRVKDILAGAGARIEGYGHYRPEKTDKEMADDVLKVWDILWSDQSAFAGQVGWFQQVLKNNGEEKSPALTAKAPVHFRVNDRMEVKAEEKVLQKLHEAGILTQLVYRDGQAGMTFKNEALRSCLTSHGIWLELYGFLKAYRTAWFNDVKTSVLIGWTEENDLPHSETRNEMDIMLVKGVTPVFVSCKMGQPTPLALSEVRLLSGRFGGELAKTVLLTASDVFHQNPALYNRARELGVAVIDKNDIAEDAVAQRLQQVASGSFRYRR
ncbi:MAG: hypothetical protein Q4G07_06795 [Oscillospiraceae bacterium]|nr:hypothetical protein [Oscillospiraceae bacterium]